MKHFFIISFVFLILFCIRSLFCAEDILKPDKYDVVSSTQSGTIDKRTNLEKLSDPNPIIRRNALIYIGAEKKKEYVNNIIPLLNDENVEVVRAAVNALARIGDKKALNPLIEKYKNEKDINIKLSIIMALGDLKYKESIGLLLSILKDPYPAFRTESIRALGKIKAPETYSQIINMLDDEAEGVKVMTMNVIRDLKLQSASNKLIKELSNPVSVVRLASISALSVVGNLKDIPELEKLLEDPDIKISQEASKAIQNIKERENLKRIPNKN